MDKFLKRHIIELALKHKLTQQEIIGMFFSQFEHAANVMKEDSVKPLDERRSIKIKHIGEFKFNKRKVEKIEKLKYGKTMATSTPENREGVRINEDLH
jgi:hypothetical protein